MYGECSCKTLRSCYRIGSIKKSDSTFYVEKNVQWNNGGTNILGIVVTDKDKIQKENYEPILTKIDSTLNSW